MSSNYFKKVVIQARELDDGIDKLARTWKIPHVLIGRFGEHTDETISHIEAVWNIIQNIQNGIEETISEMDHQSEDSVSMEQFLQEAKTEYESLKEQCNYFNGVLTKYGYHYDPNDTLNQTNGNSSKSFNENSFDEKENLKIKSKDVTLTSNDSYASCIYDTCNK